MKIIRLKAKIKKKQSKIIRFFVTVYAITFNKKRTNGTMTSGLLGGLVSYLFNSLAFFGLLFLWYGGKSVFNTIKEVVSVSGVNVDNIATVLIRVFILVLIAIFSLIFRAVANEMKEEKDRNYIVTVFSGVVGFAALIVAVIALLKGVG